MKKPVLLLDVMGTLVTEPFEKYIPQFFKMTLKELREVKHPHAWIEFEHGRIDEHAYCASFFKDGRPIDQAGLKACLHDSYEWMEGVEPLLMELKEAGFSMHALSNYSSWYKIIESKLGLSRFLQWSFVSCDTGLRKPDPEAYLGAARALGVQPQECLFVDDRALNVDAAQKAGLRAILRTESIQDLRCALTDEGIFQSLDPS